MALEDNAHVTTIMNGKIDHVLNKAVVGTINNGEIDKVCDNAKICSQNNGTIKLLMGDANIDAQIEGSVDVQEGDSQITYSQGGSNNFSVTLPLKQQSVRNLEEPEDERQEASSGEESQNLQPNEENLTLDEAENKLAESIETKPAE